MGTGSNGIAHSQKLDFDAMVRRGTADIAVI